MTHDILRRSLAPLTDDAWREIDEQAARQLCRRLSARRFVDFSGPHGWSLGAVNLGRLEVEEGEPIDGVTWGLRSSRPVVEVRVPFHVDQMELDSVTRGLRTPRLDEVDVAARHAALFEEKAIYRGFEGGRIRGILESSAHDPVALEGVDGLDEEAVQRAVASIEKAGVGGPYALILEPSLFEAVMAGDRGGYPLSRRLRTILDGGEILWSEALEGGLVVSTSEGNFELTVGVDFSVGYVEHDRQRVELYLTESFTFEVLEEGAAVELRQAR